VYKANAHQQKEGRKLKILIEGHKLDQVEQFVYLGSLVTEDGRCTKEVRRRIAKFHSNIVTLMGFT